MGHRQGDNSIQRSLGALRLWGPKAWLSASVGFELGNI